MKLERFQVRDVAFLAIMAALLFLCGAVAMPLMSITLFGLRNMVMAVFYGAFCAITLLRVRKPGALSLLIFFNSAILLMMTPVMFVTNSVSAVCAEGITMAVFRGYKRDRAVYCAASLFIPCTLPLTAVFSVLINGVSYSEVLGGSPLSVLTCLGAVVLSVLGCRIGCKIGKELQKAGKL